MLTSGRQGALVLATIIINWIFNNNKEPEWDTLIKMFSNFFPYKMKKNN